MLRIPFIFLEWNQRHTQILFNPKTKFQSKPNTFKCPILCWYHFYMCRLVYWQNVLALSNIAGAYFLQKSHWILWV